ncbi:AsnC family protein [Arsenicicoccus sp. MKL-02]|uniref:AsnC family protein n=1 Tax=Arsenicicoccus cauae TaxID=2663847 RepID=A0A6I3IFQ6_9MICO|nr:AsnC family protein [Arsenicicoccus cauae]
MLPGRCGSSGSVSAARPITLAAVAELHREVDRAEAVVVPKARTRGASWAEIARVLGVSRQAVHKKYGGTRLGHS